MGGLRHRRAVAALSAIAALSGCASSARAPAGVTATTSSAPTPTGSRSCLAGTLTIIYPPGDNTLHSACVHLATTVQVTLSSARGYQWTAPTSSDPSTATLETRTDADGTRHVQVRLLRPGSTTLASTGTRAADPHGFPILDWSVALTIIP